MIDYNDILPREKLNQIAEIKAKQYQQALPFSHGVFDNFFPEKFLREVAGEFPEREDSSWTRFKNNREKKLASEGDELLGSNTRALISNLYSGTFINFLEKLTGIEGLVPDPSLVGGGMHRIERGGKLSVHIDFNKHPTLNLQRRLNVLVYLNEDWDESYGGHFELWDKDMTQAEVKILPLFNRMAMFSTTEESWHGHPEPLTCPENRSRRSIALYYYTVGRDDGFEKAAEHTTVFKARPGEDDLFDDVPAYHSNPLKKLAKKIIPQTVINGIKSI